MYKSGIELPKVSFASITYARIPVGGYFIGFDLDNSGKLSKINNVGVITVIEGGSGSGGSGVTSVTGLDIDNTDPQNPIVQIAVDGTSITGLGTASSPLIANGISYTLPTASSTVLGGIKIGTGLSIDGSGIVSATGGGGASNFYLSGTTTDAGSDKINSIERTGAINTGNDSYFNSVRIGMGLGNISTNTAVGKDALNINTTGYLNTAIGVNTLKLNTIGYANVAVGSNVLSNITTGDRNTAIGVQSLMMNTIGASNTAVGMYSLANNTTGSNNIGLGVQSLYNNLNGIYNIGIGTNALYNNTLGSNNIALGSMTNSNNFNNSIMLGNQATSTGNNQFVVGSSAVNAGTITTGSVTQTKYWSVTINGIPVKILLAD